MNDSDPNNSYFESLDTCQAVRNSTKCFILLLTDLTLGPPNVAHRAATRAVAGIVEAAAARRQGDTVQQFVIRWGEDFLTKLPMRKPLNYLNGKGNLGEFEKFPPNFHKVFMGTTNSFFVV